MAKKIDNKCTDAVIENLKGFARKGVREEDFLAVSTGYFALDYAIQYGVLPGEDELTGSTFKKYDPSKPLGIPLGRIAEFYGAEGSGKSYLAHRVVGCAQKQGLLCAWIDAERTYSRDLALINGVDLDNLIMADLMDDDNPDHLYYAEDILDAIIAFIKNGVKVVVLDSVANLVPKARMEAGAEQQYYALTARLLSDNLGKIAQWAGSKGALVICINQLRDKPGVSFGPSTTTPGGRALKHNASLRVEITKRMAESSLIFVDDEKSSTGKRLIGRHSGLKIEKNKFARPLLDANGKNIILDLPIYYEPYIQNAQDVAIDSARQQKIVFVRKGVFKWNESDDIEHKVEGKVAFGEYLLKNNLLDKLIAQIKIESDKTNTPLPPELVHLEIAKKESKE